MNRARTFPSRRDVLRDCLLAATALPLGTVAKSFADELPKAAGRAGTSLSGAVFATLPLGAVMPTGWLRDMLQLQADGLSGHLDETWPDVGPNSGWLGGTGESWERGPYYLDGLVPLAYLLDDAGLKANAQRYLEWTLASQDESGMFGPKSNNDWWPRMVMLKVLTQYEEATGDPRVLPFLQRYFAYQLKALPGRPLRDWGKFRWQDNALVALWLHERTGAPELLVLVRLLHDQGHDWIAQYADFQYKSKITREYVEAHGGGMGDVALSTHGVNNGQALKTGAVWSLVSGSAADRRAVQTMLGELDEYHGLPNGMFSCDEHLAGRNPSQGSELCTVVETMFSLEQSLAILGDAAMGDRLEKLAFNALPGTISDDMWSHQYNQEPNQVECSEHAQPWTTDGPESNLFGLEPNFGCCTANFHQGWPKFAASVFMGLPDGGLVAAAYAPATVTLGIKGEPVTVACRTNYPFEETVTFTMESAQAQKFPFLLRIPAWAAGATIKVNGAAVATPVPPGSFARVERTWKAGDRVELQLPMQPRVSRWFNSSVAVERGPLVFSYAIGQDWLKLRDRGLTADWQIYPETQWNYGLVLAPADPAHGIEVVRTAMTAHPFRAKSSPVQLRVRGRKLPNWVAEDGVAQPVPVSPVVSAEKDEVIPLLPYAGAKLRITAFPEVKV